MYKRQASHRIPFSLHILYQSDLRPGAVQIMPRTVSLEIHIPLQIVGQEAHAALHGHQLCAHGKHLNFLLGQAAAAAFQIAVRIADVYKRQGQSMFLIGTRSRSVKRAAVLTLQTTQRKNRRASRDPNEDHTPVSYTHLVLYEHVRAAFEQLDMGEQEIHRIHTLGIGQIRFGVSTTPVSYTHLIGMLSGQTGSRTYFLAD